MAKKRKAGIPERSPTKRQLSKWQRQERIRRIVIVAAVAFLVGISSWVGYEYYKDYQAKVVIRVDNARFNMEYFVTMLDVSTAGVNASTLYYHGGSYGGMVADAIITAELMRRAAKKDLGIEISADEIQAQLRDRRLPDKRVYREVYRDLMRARLLAEKVRQHFDPGANATMEQAHIQVMLVESREVADEVIAKIKAGGNFTALVGNFSCNSSVEGDLGMLPRELMPNDLIANVAFNLTVGQVSQPIYDASAGKELGYWLIKVTAAQNETIDAMVMLLGSKAEAERVRAELAAGGNFSALAANYSQHESKTKGGKLEGLKRGDMRSPVFDRVAFNLTLNTLSEPVLDTLVGTTGGYWIVNVIDRVTGVLGEEVAGQVRDKRVGNWLDKWRKGATIENRLDEKGIKWAVEEVIKRREGG